MKSEQRDDNGMQECVKENRAGDGVPFRPRGVLHYT